MFRAISKVLLAPGVLMTVVSSTASAQGFLTFGGSLVSVSPDVSQRERLDSTGVGLEVTGSVPLTLLIVASGGLGLDSHGFTPGSQTLGLLARRLAVGVTTPGLYFNGEESRAIFYVGADVGHEWLSDDVMLKGSSYVERHARVMFLDAGGHLWGINVAWRVYPEGGSYKRRVLLGATLEF